jgi:hypothetical protein
VQFIMSNTDELTKRWRIVGRPCGQFQGCSNLDRCNKI